MVGKKDKKIRASCTTFFGRKKRCLAHITEPSNDDYDNDVSDHNFGTFDDFGVKNDQKVSLNMILMSKYKGEHGGKKRIKKFRQGPPPLPPFSGNARKKSIFVMGGVPLHPKREKQSLRALAFLDDVTGSK